MDSPKSFMIKFGREEWRVERTGYDESCFYWCRLSGQAVASFVAASACIQGGGACRSGTRWFRLSGHRLLQSWRGWLFEHACRTCARTGVCRLSLAVPRAACLVLCGEGMPCGLGDKRRTLYRRVPAFDRAGTPARLPGLSFGEYAFHARESLCLQHGGCRFVGRDCIYAWWLSARFAPSATGRCRKHRQSGEDGKCLAEQVLSGGEWRPLSYARPGPPLHDGGHQPERPGKEPDFVCFQSGRNLSVYKGFGRKHGCEGTAGRCRRHPTGNGKRYSHFSDARHHPAASA